jgi:hypothetical protein
MFFYLLILLFFISVLCHVEPAETSLCLYMNIFSFVGDSSTSLCFAQNDKCHAQNDNAGLLFC